MTQTSYEHIALDESNTPVIRDTSMKVVELVLDHVAYGWSPEELVFQHPDLTLGQIHSALAYYWDHRAEMDRDVQARLQKIDRLRYEARQSPLQSRLRT